MDNFQISLAAARVNAGLTQEQVADKMKVNKVTILNWEKGKVCPSFSDLYMLADIYKIPIDYIFLPSTLT